MKRSLIRGRATRLGLRILAGVAGLSGLVVLLVLLLRGRLGTADSAASVIGGVAILVSAVAWAVSNQARDLFPSSPEQVESAFSSLANEIGKQWNIEAERRGLKEADIADLTWLTTGTAEGIAARTPEEADLSRRIVDLYERSKGRRLLITGPPGSGKSTILILLTLGLLQVTLSLLQSQNFDGPIPVIVTVGTWDFSSESFERWIMRRLDESYPFLRDTTTYGSNALEQLLNQNRLVLLLDGLDELEPETAPKVVDSIRDAWPLRRPLIVTSRASTIEAGEAIWRSLGAVGQHAFLTPLTPKETLRFISSRNNAESRPSSLIASTGFRPPSWLRRLFASSRPSNLTATSNFSPQLGEQEISFDDQEFMSELSNPESLLAVVLRTPFYAALTRVAIAKAGSNSIQALRRLAVTSGEEAVRTELIETFVSTTFNSYEDIARTWGNSRRWGTRARRQQLIDIARLTEDQGDNNIAWWRLQPLLPLTTWAVTIGVVAGAMYWLTADLPVGLRRGAALGFTLSIAIGITRGRVAGRGPGVLAGVVSSITIFAAGVAVIGAWFALEDAIELGLAIGISTAFLPSMFGTWRGLIKMTIVIPVVIGSLTGIIQGVVGGTASGVDRFLSTALGTPEVILIPGIFSLIFGFAELADQPSSLTFTFQGRGGRLISHLTIGILVGVAIGVGAGIETSFHHSAADLQGGGGSNYGIHVGITYALSVGLGVGMVGGLVRWLNLPDESAPVASPISTLRASRTTALVYVLIPIITAAIAVIIMHRIGFVTPGAVIAGVQRSATPISGAELGLATGIVFASALTAYPAYVVIQAWEICVTRGGPLLSLMSDAYRRELLRREGALYQFRHVSVQEYLAEKAPAVLGWSGDRSIESRHSAI